MGTLIHPSPFRLNQIIGGREPVSEYSTFRVLCIIGSGLIRGGENNGSKDNTRRCRNFSNHLVVACICRCTGSENGRPDGTGSTSRSTSIANRDDKPYSAENCR